MTHHAHSIKHALGAPPAKSEAGVRQQVAAMFRKQLQAVLANLPKALANPKAKVLDAARWNKALVDATYDDLLTIIRAGGDKALKSIRGKKGMVDIKSLSQKAGAAPAEWLEDPEVLEAIDGMTYKFAENINENTEEALRDELYEAQEAGETIDQITGRIEELYADWQGYRAERIARTESARAYTMGHIEAWRSTGVVNKMQWTSSPDACPFCLDMNGETVALDDTFFDEGDEQEVEWNGKIATLSQDYGDVQGPPLHPNCRCALVGVLNEEPKQNDQSD